MVTKHDKLAVAFTALGCFYFFLLGMLFGQVHTWYGVREDLSKWCASNIGVVKTAADSSLLVFFIISGLPHILSAITIYMNILAGSKRPRAWAVGLVGQVGWTVWIVVSANWGFLPMNLALWVIYLRNHMRWVREAAGARGSKSD